MGSGYFVYHLHWALLFSLPVSPLRLIKCTFHFCSISVFLCTCRSYQLRFVLAPGPTIASQTLVPQGTSHTQIEVCPQGGAIVEYMSGIIAEHGGCALIVDYGEDGSNRHTLRVSCTGICFICISRSISSSWYPTGLSYNIQLTTCPNIPRVCFY